MIKQVNRITETMTKTEYEAILDNLLIDFHKQVFTLFYVEKMLKKDIEKKLKISSYKLDKTLEIIRKKISKMPQFDCKFRVDDTTEYRLRDRCHKLGKSREYEEFCVMKFIKRLKNREIADIMCLDVETIKKYARIRKKELESN